MHEFISTENQPHPIIEDMLIYRGITTREEQHAFLEPDYDRDVHDPFLFDDMGLAVDRINHAIDREEQIVVYGDYDADGVTSAVILYDTLRTLNARVSVFFNHRERDGYGMRNEAIDAFAETGVRLIITTDLGISNAPEIDHATSLDIDTIVTDHHTVPTRAEDLPRAHAIIHPRVHADAYPWKQLSGGGSAFKLSQALLRNSAGDRRRATMQEKWFLDLVAISIIGDCVPVQGENKALLHYGLRVLRKTKREGLRQLISCIPSYYSPYSIEALQFSLIPALNAAGRMDHASAAFDLLTAETHAEAQQHSAKLHELNMQRQKLSDKIFREAKHACAEQVDKNIMVASSYEWPLSVLGLVAGKLCRLYEKPIVLLSCNDERIAGVGRSTPAFDIAEIFSRCSHLFSRHGGHRAAGGFALKEGIAASDCAAEFHALQLYPSYCDESEQTVSGDVPREISLQDISLAFAKMLIDGAPWSMNRPTPLFISRQCSIQRIETFGKLRQHLRVDVVQKGYTASFVRLRGARLKEELFEGMNGDITFDISLREVFGDTRISLTLFSVKVLEDFYRPLSQ